MSQGNGTSGPDGGTRVLLVGVALPPRLALEAAVPALRAAGATVDAVVTRAPGTAFTGLDVRTVRVAKLLRSPSGRKPRRGTPLWLALAVRWRVLRLAQSRSGPMLSAWRILRQDPQLRRLAREADVVVALDRLAAYTVWRLSRRVTSAACYNGLAAAVQHVAEPPLTATAATATAATAVTPATAPRVARAEALGQPESPAAPTPRPAQEQLS
jgi:hypothetical protein